MSNAECRMGGCARGLIRHSQAAPRSSVCSERLPSNYVTYRSEKLVPVVGFCDKSAGTLPVSDHAVRRSIVCTDINDRNVATSFREPKAIMKLEAREAGHADVQQDHVRAIMQ